MQKEFKKNLLVGWLVGVVLLMVIVGIFWGLKKSLQTAATTSPIPAALQTAKLAIAENPKTASDYSVVDKGEKGTEVSLPTKMPFKMTLPKKLSDPILISLSENRTIEILQTDGASFQALPTDQNLQTPENSKLLSVIQKTQNLSAYQTADGNQTVLYTAPNNPNNPNLPNDPNSPTAQWLFKNWTIYNTPPVTQTQEAKPPLGGLASSDEITQTFQFKNASVKIEANGNADIFFDDGKSPIATDPDFTIPKPYFLDKDGNKTDLVWKFDQAAKILSTSFSAKAQAYPIALDPSVLKTNTLIATFSGKAISMNAACGAGLTCGNNCTYNSVTYGTVLIGGQCWMNQNMMTDKYADGTSIVRGPVASGGLWTGSDNGFYAYPPNAGPTPAANTQEESLANIQAGKLGFVYQWSAAMKGANPVGNQGICPNGWHVPTHDEFTTLERAVCTSSSCATNFPFDTSTTGWLGTNEGSRLSMETSGGNNFSGFTGHLAGNRNTTGAFAIRSSYAFFWSSSSSGSNAWNRGLYSGGATVYRYTYSKAYGFSVRCLKN